MCKRSENLSKRVAGRTWFTGLLLLYSTVAFFNSNAQAQDPGIDECLASGATIVTMGITEQYLGLVARSEFTSDVPNSNSGANDTCFSVASGNEYQVLEWLETGKIKSGVVSPFVAEILQRRGEKPLGEFFRFSPVIPTTGAPFPGYRVGLQVFHGATRIPNPSDAYSEIVHGMLAASEEGAGNTTRLMIDSYLSVALPLLLDHTETALKETEISDDKQRRQFWRLFFDQIMLCKSEDCLVPEGDATTVRVTKLPESGGATDMTFLLNGGESLQDLFVHDESLHKRFLLQDVSTTGLQLRSDGAIYRWLDNEEFAKGGSPGHLVEEIYAAHEAGFRTHRHFPFTIDELWSLLGGDQRDAASIALILTGGGVKAAFQTKLIDHLYACGYLTNGGDSNRDTCVGVPDTFPVDQIIGTSGGAMLGAFVAWMANESNPNLSETLWRLDDGDYIEFFNIFPWIEMPRWLTLVFAALVFSLVLFAFDEIQQLRRRRSQRKSGGADSTVERVPASEQERFSGFPPRAVWALLLFLTPFVLKITNGLQGLEHVPATAGVVYALCMLIAVISDNRLVFDRRFQWSTIHFGGKGLLLLISGVILIFLPFLGVLAEEGFQFGVLGGITTATLICCVGLISLFLATHMGLAAADGTEKVPSKQITGALLIIFAVWPISTFLVWISGKSLFELSLEFWRNFAVWTLVVSIAVTAVGRWVSTRGRPSLLKSGFDFLLSPFPKTTFFANLKRHARITFFIAAGFTYWNVVMAPGIYGNETAVRFFNQMFCDYITRIDGGVTSCESWIDEEIRLAPGTNFVVTATSLEQKKERYFVFHPSAWRPPGGRPHSGSEVSDAVLDELSKRDPRWSMAGPHVTWGNTLKVLFASGSPFPVFPATRAGIAPNSKQHEWLVDGGYAHNVPIEAANAVGARTVLVISSSILHQHRDTSRSAAEYGRELVRSPTGNLWKNIPRLFPYLFERSQIEDAVSADEMVVATLSPINRDQWPMLTDFKSDVVADLLRAAEEDATKRIGMVESWGTPICRLGKIAYRCEEINVLQTNQSQ